LAVAVTDATPRALVAVVAEGLNVADAPEPGGANVTATPETGLPLASVTDTESAVANAVLTVVLCGLPPTTVTEAAGPAVFVSVNVAEVAPLADALTGYVPATVSAVAVTEARPVASVVAGEPRITADAPPPGAVNVTATFGTGLPSESVTRATSADPNAEPTVAVCGLPLFTVTVAAGPGVFVSENEAVVATPAVSALTAYAPATVFAVAATVARPALFVVAGDATITADAPELGGVNVTATPGTGLPLESVTRATSDWANAVPTVALCALPLLIAMFAASPEVFVSANVAGVRPETVAVTENAPAVELAIATMLVCPVGPVAGVAAERETEAPVDGAA
jgi:hypothetical protein